MIPLNLESGQRLLTPICKNQVVNVYCKFFNLINLSIPQRTTVSNRIKPLKYIRVIYNVESLQKPSKPIFKFYKSQ